MPVFRYYTATSLDGFIADEHDGLDWLLSQPIDEHGPMNYDDFISGVGALVMGATTYEWLVRQSTAAEWPYDLPSYIFTHRSLAPAAPNVAFLAGAPADHRQTLLRAAGGKDVWVVGGGDLAAQFAEAGMLDDVIVSIAPVFLGRGRPLFTGRLDLELEEVDRNRAFTCARYSVRR